MSKLFPWTFSGQPFKPRTANGPRTLPKNDQVYRSDGVISVHHRLVELTILLVEDNIQLSKNDQIYRSDRLIFVNNRLIQLTILLVKNN